ncbi:MAG: cupin domain-containing protein [Prevotella sp.]|nr:cupin domain-containing protein [Prevotella sp.]
MSEVKKIGEGNGYVNATVGNPCEFEGKVFTKDILGTTSCDISFGSLAPGQAVPFYHDHKENEEVYIVLCGKGRFQVDKEAFDIEPGAMVRVAIGHSRNIKNTGDTNMVYICVQAKQDSLAQWVQTDAIITEEPDMM